MCDITVSLTLTQFTTDEAPFCHIYDNDLEKLRGWVRGRKRRRRSLDKQLTRDVSYESSYTYQYGMIHQGTTPFWCAIVLEFFEGAKLLINAGCDVNSKCTVRVFFPSSHEYTFFYQDSEEETPPKTCEFKDGRVMCDMGSRCMHEGKISMMFPTSDHPAFSGDEGTIPLFDVPFTVQMHDSTCPVLYADFGDYNSESGVVQKMVSIGEGMKSFLADHAGIVDNMRELLRVLCPKMKIVSGIVLDAMSYLILRTASAQNPKSSELEESDVLSLQKPVHEACVELIGLLIPKMDVDEVNHLVGFIAEALLGMTPETARHVFPYVFKGCLCQYK